MNNVETMFSARTVPWHKKGTIVQTTLNSTEAIIAAGLDWNVVQKPIYLDNQTNIDDYCANVRTSDNSVLGIVTERYRIVQNQEAFDFTNTLTNQGLEFETAGSLNGGRTIWLLAKLPDVEIVGDKTTPYIVFTNSHDGKKAITVAMTPIRVVCQNTLNLAIANATRKWSSRHMGDMESKLIEARKTLNLAQDYLFSLSLAGNNLAKQSIGKQYVVDMSNILFPVKDGMTQRQQDNAKLHQIDLMQRWELAPDLTQFRDTKWGVMNAVSDHALHFESLRKTENGWETAFSKLINGNATIDSAYEYVLRN